MKLFDLDDVEEEDVTMFAAKIDSIQPESVVTPTGEELVFPGWDKKPTIELARIDQALIDACKDRQKKTVRAMRAVIPPLVRHKGHP